MTVQKGHLSALRLDMKYVTERIGKWPELMKRAGIAPKMYCTRLREIQYEIDSLWEDIAP